MKKYKHGTFTVLILIALIKSTYGEIIKANDYKFPKFDALRSTVGSTLMKTPKRKYFDRIRLKIRPERPEAPRRFRKIYIQHYSPNQDSKKLVLIMTGIGGNGKGNIGNFLAHEFTKKGFHSLVIPSLFFKRFSYAASSHGHSGFIAEDVKDYYRGMQIVIKHLEKKIGHSIKKVSLVGYSLGAMAALHLAHEDSIQRDINYDKVIALNTPVDLKYGIDTLDSFYQDSLKLSSVKKYKTLLSLGLNIQRKKSNDLNSKKFSDFMLKTKKMTSRELQTAVVFSLRQSLSGIVLATQNINDINVLPKNINRRRAARKFTFADYVNKILLPFYRIKLDRPRLTFADLSKLTSLPSIERFLKGAKNVYLMHNADDFLLRKGDVKYLNRVFGDRAVIYPHGGHLGNVWFKDNLDQMFEWAL